MQRATVLAQVAPERREAICRRGVHPLQLLCEAWQRFVVEQPQFFDGSSYCLGIAPAEQRGRAPGPLVDAVTGINLDHREGGVGKMRGQRVTRTIQGLACFDPAGRISIHCDQTIANAVAVIERRHRNINPGHSIAASYLSPHVRGFALSRAFRERSQFINDGVTEHLRCVAANHCIQTLSHPITQYQVGKSQAVLAVDDGDADGQRIGE